MSKRTKALKVIQWIVENVRPSKRRGDWRHCKGNLSQLEQLLEDNGFCWNAAELVWIFWDEDQNDHFIENIPTDMIGRPGLYERVEDRQNRAAVAYLQEEGYFYCDRLGKWYDTAEALSEIDHLAKLVKLDLYALFGSSEQ